MGARGGKDLTGTPLAVRENRQRVTGEPEPSGSSDSPAFPDVDWIGQANQGGGYVPEDYEWPTNPKQWQEEQLPFRDPSVPAGL